MKYYDFLYSILLALAMIVVYHLFFDGGKKLLDIPEPDIEEEVKERSYDDSEWSYVLDFDPTIIEDIRYATANNFVEEQLYDCGKCFLRPKVAEALINANIEFGRSGYRIKVFDCYRPRPVQQALWDKVPDPNYVTPPDKGSMHNRGAAVDLTLVDENGYELNMGTGYDYFGKEAYHDYLDLPEDILQNRSLLKSVMESHGFTGIRTEWWHYSLTEGRFPISEWLWSCE